MFPHRLTRVLIESESSQCEYGSYTKHIYQNCNLCYKILYLIRAATYPIYEMMSLFCDNGVWLPRRRKRSAAVRVRPNDYATLPLFQYMILFGIRIYWVLHNTTYRHLLMAVSCLCIQYSVYSTNLFILQ